MKKLYPAAKQYYGIAEFYQTLLNVRDEYTLKSNCISIYFPKRLELSFLFVLAFPNAYLKSTPRMQLRQFII